MLPPVRRVVTGHDELGRARIHADGALATTAVPSGDARFALLWTTDTTPADNTDPTDGAARTIGLTSPGGSVFRMVDIAPGCRSPMHRTQSVDYGVVLSGEVELEVDGGVVTRLHAGDTVVQRGTVHAWVNRSEAWCRIAFVLIEAAPVTVGGRTLPATH